MEYQLANKLFKNASSRNAYVQSVLDAFENAYAEHQSHAELISLYESFKPRIDAMIASPEEYDQLAAEMVVARYRAMHARLEESREWVWQQLREMQERGI